MYLSIVVITTVTGDIQFCLVLFEVRKEATIGHKRRDDVRGWPPVEAHPCQGENVGMLEVIHL
jgi:hypothetical protein